jgi:hypothetical protein
MKDLKYLKERDWFSNFAFEVFHKYFPDRSAFDIFVDSIATDMDKSRFLKVASFYKFLVKDGRFFVPGYEDAEYFDQTYRFLAICAFIELVEPNVRSKGFYKWVKGSATAFPIQNPQNLETLHQQYSQAHPRRLSTKMVSFFQRLDDASRKELELSITINRQPMPIEEVALTLYGLRSKFMHDAELIHQLSGVASSSAYHLEKQIKLPLERIERMFERGVLLRFGYRATGSWPK